MIDQSRKVFEAWYVKAYHPVALQQKENGCYLNLGAGMAWDAWQAATAAERERCASLCDRFANRMMIAEECADAIRRPLPTGTGGM